MPSPRHKIIERSRDRDFLLRTSIIIGIVAIALGFVIAQFGPAKGKLAGMSSMPPGFGELDLDLEEYVRDLMEGVAEDGQLPEQFSVWEHMFDGKPVPPEVVASLIRNGVFTDRHLESINTDLRPIFLNYAETLLGRPDRYNTARDSLIAAAGETPPPRFANEFAGHLLQRENDHASALTYFARELENFPQTTFARRAELASLLKLDDKDALRDRTEDPLVEASVPRGMFAEALIATNQWGRLSLISARDFIAGFEPVWVGIALFAAMVWFIILGQLGGLESGTAARMMIFITAFLLGCVSTFLVIPAIYFQDRVVGLTENGQFLNDAVFYISGVALREELFKLLMFVPLLPVLLKRRSSMEALAAAACVGLGFAFIENFDYTGSGKEGGLFARLITANFLHAGWTGLAGLALFHLFRWPKTRWEEFLATFIGVIAAHGFYNLFSSGAAWSQFAAGLPPVIVLALTAYRYLDMTGEVRDGPRADLSPFGVFVIGSTLVLAFSWLHACWHMPMADVLEFVGGSALRVGAMVFIFINRLRNE